MSTQENKKIRVSLQDWENLNQLNQLQVELIEKMMPSVQEEDNEQIFEQKQIILVNNQNSQNFVQDTDILTNSEQEKINYLNEKNDNVIQNIKYYKIIKNQNEKFNEEFLKLKQFKNKIIKEISDIYDKPDQMLKESQNLTVLQDSVMEINQYFQIESMKEKIDEIIITGQDISMNQKQESNLQRYLGETIERILYLESHSEYLEGGSVLSKLYPLKNKLLANIKSLLFKLIAKEENYCQAAIQNHFISFPFQTIFSEKQSQHIYNYLQIHSPQYNAFTRSLYKAFFPEFQLLFQSNYNSDNQNENYQIQYSSSIINLIKFLYDQSSFNKEISMLLKKSVEEYYTCYRSDLHNCLQVEIQKQLEYKLEYNQIIHIVYLIIETLFYENLYYSYFINFSNRKYQDIVLQHLIALKDKYVEILKQIISDMKDIEELCCFTDFIKNIINNSDKLVKDFQNQQQSETELFKEITENNKESIFFEFLEKEIVECLENEIKYKQYFLSKRKVHRLLQEKQKRREDNEESVMRRVLEMLKSVSTRMDGELFGKVSEEILETVLEQRVWRGRLGDERDVRQWVETLDDYLQVGQWVAQVDTPATFHQHPLHNTAH